MIEWHERGGLKRRYLQNKQRVPLDLDTSPATPFRTERNLANVPAKNRRHLIYKNRPAVMLPPRNKKEKRPSSQPTPHNHNSIIHILCRDGLHARERAKHHGHQQEGNRDPIDHRTQDRTESEGAISGLGARSTAVDGHVDDGDDVGCIHSQDRHGEDGVECGAVAEVDEAEESLD